MSFPIHNLELPFHPPCEMEQNRKGCAQNSEQFITYIFSRIKFDLGFMIHVLWVSELANIFERNSPISNLHKTCLLIPGHRETERRTKRPDFRQICAKTSNIRLPK
jgi:hypothetical protein